MVEKAALCLKADHVYSLIAKLPQCLFRFTMQKFSIVGCFVGDFKIGVWVGPALAQDSKYGIFVAAEPTKAYFTIVLDLPYFLGFFPPSNRSHTTCTSTAKQN